VWHVTPWVESWVRETDDMVERFSSVGPTVVTKGLSTLGAKIVCPRQRLVKCHVDKCLHISIAFAMGL